MANTLVKWKRGALGYYEAYIMYKSDWEGLGFEGDDTTETVFNRANNFTIVGDNLPGVQMDFFENNSDFEIKEVSNPEQLQSTESKAAAVNRAGIAGGSAERQVVDFSEDVDPDAGEPGQDPTASAAKAKSKAGKAT